MAKSILQKYLFLKIRNIFMKIIGKKNLFKNISLNASCIKEIISFQTIIFFSSLVNLQKFSHLQKNISHLKLIKQISEYIYNEKESLKKKFNNI